MKDLCGERRVDSGFSVTSRSLLLCCHSHNWRARAEFHNLSGSGGASITDRGDIWKHKPYLP